MEDIVVRYLHFISIMTLVSALVAEHLLIKHQMTRAEVKRLSVVDAVYGLSSLTTLVAGLLLWFVVGKSADFYSANWVFHLKFSLFVIAALLSLYPTLFFLRNRKGAGDIVEIPKKIIMIIRAELLVLLLIPMLAVLMAMGVGLK